MDMKKTAELVMMGGMLVISMANANAAATTITASTKAQTADVATSAAGGYVLEAFKLNLSANVALSYDGDTTAVGVKTGSAKGMHTFGGSSNGGSVKQCEAASIASPNSSTTNVSISAGC
ncbi:hypothetical protein [Chitinimonas lacunae]|uniref:Uncharacterized protein n=1 Tax=Chitinimonas lacunae TaxID=1963018 RepID=A0ABV8MRR2_9NEIS